MKKIIFTLLTLSAVLLSLTDLNAARQDPTVGGKVLDENNNAVEFATVVLLRADSTQVTGATTSADGRFRITAPKGGYALKVYYLGYEDIIVPLQLSSDMSVDDFVLVPSATSVEKVVVTARTIVREADRFVVTIANNPVAIGKDAYEMLKASPGVWASKDGITVNGKSGTRVMVNDRLLRMDAADLEAYLRSINAEDISKIEIIPDAGAEYDADSRGGIIKITLVKQRNDGLMGNVSLTGGVGWYDYYQAGVSAGLSYQKEKLNLYGDFGYRYARDFSHAVERTDYTDGSVVNSIADLYDKGSRYNAKLGFVYDFNPKHSLGAEAGIFSRAGSTRNDGEAFFDYGSSAGAIDRMETTNDDNSKPRNNYISATVNYVNKLNDKGSVFKLIGDFNQSLSDNSQNYHDNAKQFSGSSLVSQRDSIYRSKSETDYRIMSMTANFDFVLSPTSVLKTGGKYTYNKMYSNTLYDDFKSGIWSPIDEANKETDYIEDIAALYLSYGGRFGRFGVSAGLRGEYTWMKPRIKGSDGAYMDNLSRGYFDLFPNANISYALNEKQSNSLILSYSRNISRPGFWALDPRILRLSTNSYIVGNPDLRPSYTQSASLTAVLAYKYSLSVGMQFDKDQVMQKVIPAPNGEEHTLYYMSANLPESKSFFVALNAPITITSWWTANVDAVFLNLSQVVTPDMGAADKRYFTVLTNIHMVFSLPKSFDIELSHYYNRGFLVGNMKQRPMQNMNVSVKKRFAKNKFTASLGVDNIFDVYQKVDSWGANFNRSVTMNNGNCMIMNFSLRYNFQAGQSFRAKKVEKADDADSKRIGGGN